MPASIKSVVVLPQPLGPSSARNSPWAMVQLRSCTAGTVPKYLLIPARVTVAMGRRSAWQVVGIARLPPPATAPALARHPQEPPCQNDPGATEKPGQSGRIFEGGVRFIQGDKLLLGLSVGALQGSIFLFGFQVLGGVCVLAELLVFL